MAKRRFLPAPKAAAVPAPKAEASATVETSPARRGGLVSRMMARVSSLAMAAVSSPYQAASDNKRLPSVTNVGPTDVARYQLRLRMMARHLYRNDGWLRRAVQVLCTNVVGVGPKPKSPFPELNELIAGWMPEADARGTYPLGQLLREAYKAEVVDGEVFWRLRPRRLRDGYVLPLQIQLLEADHVPLDKTELLPGGRIAKAGIVTFNDRREAYYVHPSHPHDAGERLANMGDNIAVLVPADVVLHQYRPPRFSSPRGETRFVAAIVKAVNLALYDLAEDTRKNLNALIAGFIKRPPEAMGEPLPGEQAADGSWTDLRFEPGTLSELPPGTDIVFHDPKDTGSSYEPHKRFALMYLAACFDVLYEDLVGDWRGSSDRTWRAGQVAMRRLADEERARLEHQVLNPLWRALVDLAVALGLWTPPPGLAAHEIYKVRWSWPAAKNPNQFQEYSAYGEAIDRGLIDRDSAIEELGGDPVETDLRAAAAQKRAEILGLVLKGPTSGAPTDLGDRLMALIEQEIERRLAQREDARLDRGPDGDQQ